MIFLCELNGTPIAERSFPLRTEEFAQLGSILIEYLEIFLQETKLDPNKIITFSIAVTGILDEKQHYVYQLEIAS